jgi:hypothetical protein
VVFSKIVSSCSNSNDKIIKPIIKKKIPFSIGKTRPASPIMMKKIARLI